MNKDKCIQLAFNVDKSTQWDRHSHWGISALQFSYTARKALSLLQIRNFLLISQVRDTSYVCRYEAKAVINSNFWIFYIKVLKVAYYHSCKAKHPEGAHFCIVQG